MDALEKARAGPRDGAETGSSSQSAAFLVASKALNATDSAATQASPEALGAACDLVFEGLVETGSLAESYSRSLAEAAWRGDRVTVAVTLRQLRSCVTSAVETFKLLEGEGVSA
jgi:hypothetical protein